MYHEREDVKRRCKEEMEKRRYKRGHSPCVHTPK
jgi:hypothetical protein